MRPGGSPRGTCSEPLGAEALQRRHPGGRWDSVAGPRWPEVNAPRPRADADRASSTCSPSRSGHSGPVWCPPYTRRQGSSRCLMSASVYLLMSHRAPAGGQACPRLEGWHPRGGRGGVSTGQARERCGTSVPTSERPAREVPPRLAQHQPHGASRAPGGPSHCPCCLTRAVSPVSGANLGFHDGLRKCPPPMRTSPCLPEDGRPRCVPTAGGTPSPRASGCQ